ncbi:MAG: hypothetical protein K2H34_07130 [Lachnospiraceae bacterium]|nr:hypothetical protein [Lachnospiraceae bacterium]
MRTGKLPEHTFKRSVINPIRYRRPETTLRTAVGHDGAVTGSMVTSMATTAFSYMGNERYAFDNAVNNVIAAGGKPYGAATAVLMPEHSEESTLRAITDNLARQAEQYRIEIFSGHTELVPSVVSPTVVVTVYGEKLWESRHKEVTADLDIVMTKWAGLYGGAILAALRKKELTSRYPESYITVAAEYMRYTSLIPELEILEENAEICEWIYAAHDVSNGGVFGALWQLLSACNCGAEIPIEAIPVKQEIIEVAEYFDLNPYMMNGQGSLLLVTGNGEQLVGKMNEAGIQAAILGKTTKSAERKILLGDEERFLNPPKGDALNAVFYGQPLPV